MKPMRILVLSLLMSLLPLTAGQDTLRVDGGLDLLAPPRKVEMLPLPGGPYISEVCPRNVSYVPVKGKCFDWIELCNPLDDTLSLDGWALADKKRKHLCPLDGMLMPPGSRLLIYADKDSVAVPCAVRLGLKGNGTVQLLDPSGECADRIQYGEVRADMSKGRDRTDGPLLYYTSPTPGGENASGLPRIADAPVADLPSGQYDSTVTVNLYADGRIRYTLDGSRPGAGSPVWDGPRTFSSPAVIRAVSFEEGAVPSAETSCTYIVGRSHTLDVVSVMSDPDGLYSYSRGIFVAGPGASSEPPYHGANYWKGWKRESVVQLLPASADGPGFSQHCLMSIFGGYTKANPKKAVKFKFKDVCGSPKLHYPLFESRDFDEFSAVVLRCGGQDTYRGMIRDDLASSLADTLLDVMATRPAVLYINGEYQGIYYLREKIDEDFIASHRGVDAESVSILQGTGQVHRGTAAQWRPLMDYVGSHNLAQDDCYDYVCSKVDVRSYLDYLIAEMYIGNTDMGNVRWFRSDDPRDDGRWRWIFYDSDLSMRPGEHPDALHVFDPAPRPGKFYSTKLFNALIRNSRFRALFIERLEYQMTQVWTRPRVLRELERMASAIEGEVAANQARWARPTVAQWHTQIDEIRIFVRGRQKELRTEFATSPALRRIISLTPDELDRCFPEGK